MFTFRRKNADSSRFDRSPDRGRRGETLVECLVAVALVSAVAIPALAALRAAFAGASEARSRAVSASSRRFRGRSVAALLRFGEETPGVPEGGPDGVEPLPPLRIPPD